LIVRRFFLFYTVLFDKQSIRAVEFQDMKQERKLKGPSQVFGYHLILDCYGCDKEVLDSMASCYNYLNDMVVLLKVHKQSEPFVVNTDAIKYPDKAGISAWVPLVESGISIHTLTPTNFVSIDVYSCKKYSIEKVKAFTQKVFKPLEIEEKFFLREEKYIHPKKPKAQLKPLLNK
jgi:S-adenosylmethionine decarboxylase